MSLSPNFRAKLVDEFRFVAEKMTEEINPRRKLFWFSAAYGMVPRIFNMEYDANLQFLHYMLQTTYMAIQNRLMAITGGDETVQLPDDYFEQLSDVISSLAERVENDDSMYNELRKLSNLAYLTTGNGYYLSNKGIAVAP